MPQTPLNKYLNVKHAVCEIINEFFIFFFRLEREGQSQFGEIFIYADHMLLNRPVFVCDGLVHNVFGKISNSDEAHFDFTIRVFCLQFMQYLNAFVARGFAFFGVQIEIGFQFRIINYFF